MALFVTKEGAELPVGGREDTVSLSIGEAEGDLVVTTSFPAGDPVSLSIGEAEGDLLVTTSFPAGDTVSVYEAEGDLVGSTSFPAGDTVGSLVGASAVMTVDTGDDDMVGDDDKAPTVGDEVVVLTVSKLGIDEGANGPCKHDTLCSLLSEEAQQSAAPQTGGNPLDSSELLSANSLNTLHESTFPSQKHSSSNRPSSAKQVNTVHAERYAVSGTSAPPVPRRRHLPMLSASHSLDTAAAH